MKYLANAIADYILRNVDRNSGTLRFVLPSYPAEVLLEIGRKVDEGIQRRLDRNIGYEYGIAYRLGKEWAAGTRADKACFEQIQEKGWYNKQNNLTSLRNIVKPDDVDCLVILLAGYTDVDDQASLKDFFHLDQDDVWDMCLRQSFAGWVRDCVRGHINMDDAEHDIEAICNVLEGLCNNGLAHVLDISNFLESLDFSSARDGHDAYRIVLQGLPFFGLPQMDGLAHKPLSRRNFGRYVAPAQEFLNYSMFIDEKKRETARISIDGFRQQVANGMSDVDISVLGPFATEEKPLDEFLNALEDYVDNRSETARAKLAGVDFLYVYEKVLGYKPPSPGGKEPAIPRTRKLAGLPPEVFLHGLWLTFADFEKANNGVGIDSVSAVVLESIEFRYDYDASDDENHCELAKLFMRRVLGGIDDFLEDQLRLGVGADDASIAVTSRLEPDTEDASRLSYRKHNNAEPYLKFQVSIFTHGNDKPFIRDFRWALPEYHQSRLLIDLYDWAYAKCRVAGDALPIFAVPYMSEIFMASDEETINHIMGRALQENRRLAAELHAATNFRQYEYTDKVLPLLGGLSACYQEFIEQVLTCGFFNALHSKYYVLRDNYCRVLETYIETSDCSISGPLLMKAFMLVSDNNLDMSALLRNDILEAGIVTPLHPALLEMILYQHVFLCESFCYYFNEKLKEPSAKLFTGRRWERAVELSTMRWPVFGTIGANRSLDTHVNSYGYVHLVGHPRGDSLSIGSTLLLQDKDVDEDEEITDTDLFGETMSSRLIKRTLLDYRQVHEHADDGISIGVYCGGDMQPIIAGIDSYLSEVITKERGNRLYSLKLTVFSDSVHDATFLRWVDAWKERWQQAELSQAKRHYTNCRISISYQVTSSKDDFKQLEDLVERTPLDVMVFLNFIPPDLSEFKLIGEDDFIEAGYQKFPILEKIYCRVDDGGMDSQRRRILSNHRFRLGALHAEAMARILTGPRSLKQKHAVIWRSDYSRVERTVDAAHRCSAWVVCIDPCMDEQLLKKPYESGLSRDIIGFGSGVGAHGESNYTISTEQFYLSDISEKIGSQVSAIFTPIDSESADRIAKSLMQDAQHIGGLSVVKATGPSDYVRDYMAYSMMRKLLPKNDSAFCDEMISLDAVWHWFDDAEDRKRPDLLRLHANVVDGYFDIEAQIIECKLAAHSEKYLVDARQQIENGMRQLSAHFRPRESDRPMGTADRPPDQRFWWMQLHRLIASRGMASPQDYNEALLALERLSEGYFDITWQAAAVAFWTDMDTETITCTPSWEIGLCDDERLTVSVATAGKGFFKKVCMDNIRGPVFCDDSSITFRFARPISNRGQKGNAYEAQEFSEAIAAATVPAVADRASPEPSMSSQGTLEIPLDDGEQERQLSEVPDRILLGRFTSGYREIYWEFGHPELLNRHIVIFGSSGSGKTYTIQALLLELAKAGQNSLIVDYTNGFTAGQLEPIIVDKLSPTQHVVRQEPLPINPFRRQCDYIDDQPLPETPAGVARRVTDLFASVYQIGDQQRSVLYTAIRDGIDEKGDSFTLEDLVSTLEEIQYGKGPTSIPAATLVSKMRPFVDMNPFGREDKDSWERLFTDTESRCHIVQLMGFPKDSARLITEFCLSDFYWYYRANGNKDCPRVVVLDEIQNLNHSLDSPISQLLTEGRKFGVSLILATQTMSNLGKDERDRLFQASHKLFFKPADTEVRSFAQILADSDSTKTSQSEWVERLSSLKLGECYSLGPASSEPIQKLEVGKSFRIRVTALDERL